MTASLLPAVLGKVTQLAALPTLEIPSDLMETFGALILCMGQPITVEAPLSASTITGSQGCDLLYECGNLLSQLLYLALVVFTADC